MVVSSGRFTNSAAKTALAAIAAIAVAALVPGTAAAQVATHEFGLSNEAMVRAVETVEAHIAECMREAGFEYVAVNFKSIRRGMTADKSLPGYSESEYLRQFGLGISTLYTGESPLKSDLQTPAQIGLGPNNMQIFRNLPPADQVAYNRALLGENPDVTFAVGLEIEDFSATGGCTRAAIEQVFTPEQLTTTYLSPKDVAIEQDPRMIAALDRYAECMREAGFNYSHEKEVEPDLRRRLHEITGGQPVRELSQEALAALAELQAYERALGRVAVYCEENVLDPVAERIERELFAR